MKPTLEKKIKYKKLVVLETKKNFFKSKIDKKNILDLSTVYKNHVVVKVKYSNLNFKDYLIAKGHKGLVRKFPHTPGIDAAGEVYFSNSRKFKKKENVYVIAKPLGVETNGGYSEFIVVKDKWINKVPKNFNLKKIMMIGTSGFTALKAFKKSEKVIKKFSNKPVLITAPTSNVGLFLIFLLKNISINLEVVTSKSKNINRLKKLGVKKVYLAKNFIKNNNYSLLNEKYSVVFDNVGGEVLSTSIKYLAKNGVLISIGNILDNYSTINVLPLILRGTQIIGINSENSSKQEWNYFFNFLKIEGITKKIEKYTKKINLDQLKILFNRKKFEKKSIKYLIKI